MVIHRSGRNCVALYIDGDEIASYGWNEVQEEQARILAEDALIGLGLRPRDLLEIEAFTGYDGVMIFAQVQQSDSFETGFFRFCNSDDLLEMAASTAFRPPVPSTLYLYDGCYILCISGIGTAFEQWQIHLGEYGQRLPYQKEFELFLSEHGKLLVKNCALHLLIRKND